MATRPPTGSPQPPLGWVVVANASRARIFERDDDNGALREVSDHVHPESRMKGVELERRVTQARQALQAAPTAEAA